MALTAHHLLALRFSWEELIFYLPSVPAWHVKGHLFLGTFTQLEKVIIGFIMSVCLSICPHVTTWLPPDGFSRNLIFTYFSKIC